MLNPLSVVFLVDESGSMGSVQSALQVNIPSLFSSLQVQAPGSKAGLVGYGNGIGTNIRQLSALTSNQTAFGAAAGQLVVTGGTEPGFETSIETAGAGGNFAMGFDQNLGFCVAILTDEPSNGDCASCTQQAAIDVMLNVGPTPNEANAKGIFFGIVANPETSDSYEPIANATGGAMLSLNDFVGDTKPVLDALVASCSFLLNKITLSPDFANVPIGQAHILTIGTNKLAGGVLVPQGRVHVSLVVDTTVHAATPFTFRGKTKSDGTVEVLYDPFADPAFVGGPVDFKACRRDVSPLACTTASAVFRAGKAVSLPPSSSPSSFTATLSPSKRSKSKKGHGMAGGKGMMNGGKGMMRGKGMTRNKGH